MKTKQMAPLSVRITLQDREDVRQAAARLGITVNAFMLLIMREAIRRTLAAEPKHEQEA